MSLPAIAGQPINERYPDSDGKPMADNTLQYRWIQTLEGNLAVLYRERADVFVAGDLLWYPREGYPKVCIGPEVLVVFGRPKGDRGSYRQWEEGNVPLTVVFEIRSPGNTVREMAGKLTFYRQHGVEEYYDYDPDHPHLVVYHRRGRTLQRVREAKSYVSPRLGIRFDLSGPEMTVFYPDGQPFLTFEEIAAERQREQQLRREAERLRREAERLRREAEQRTTRLAELSRKPRRGQISPKELRELEHLEEQAAPNGTPPEQKP
jgi:Uma2 family endonuclease